MAGTNGKETLICEGPSIILVGPQLGENIGMAARAMANFGLSDLRLVKPRDGWPSDKARSASSGALHVIDNAKVFETTEEAIADLQFVLATTARRRDMVKEIYHAEQAGVKMRSCIDSGQKTGYLFGREKSGLENNDIALADAIVTFAVNPGFSSINLAQSVLLIGHEWFKTYGDITYGDGDMDGGAITETGLHIPTPIPATKQDLVRFFEHLESELDVTGFLFPPEKRDAMVRNIRNMFQRSVLTHQEVQTLRGIITALTKHNRRVAKKEAIAEYLEAQKD
ncbi:MAG: RNA methyltransferase [Rhizobiales bacterium]|nr:RNA methyltransferase [Hyphomicrobiales bacterium]